RLVTKSQVYNLHPKIPRAPKQCIRELSALGARPSGRLSVSKPRNLEYPAKAAERATSKRRERRAPLPTTLECTRATTPIDSVLCLFRARDKESAPELRHEKTPAIAHSCFVRFFDVRPR